MSSFGWPRSMYLTPNVTFNFVLHFQDNLSTKLPVSKLFNEKEISAYSGILFNDLACSRSETKAFDQI